MVPSTRQVSGSGATVGIFDEEGEEVALGHADENGELHARISNRFIGHRSSLRVRRAGFLFDHELVVVVQPWGLFHAVRMTPDQVYVGEISASDKEFMKNADEKYVRGEAHTQYAARNAISRTHWFWLVAALSLLSALITTGLPVWVGVPATAVVVVVADLLTIRSLGLSKKPID